MTIRIALLAVLAALLGPTPALGLSAARAGSPSTLASLQAAFESDARAQARYVAFAARAEQEGFRGVALLFRAAARSEEVRARSHAEAIRHLGGEPRTPPAAAVGVDRTRQNLLATLAHENAERLGAYPRLVRQARADGEPVAVLSFILAHAAESGLVRLYQDALANLARMRPQGAPLVVCATCGHVERGAAPEWCPVCLSQRGAFERVR